MTTETQKLKCLFGQHPAYGWVIKGKTKTYRCTKCNKLHPEYPVLKIITYKKYGYELRDEASDMKDYGGEGVIKIQSAYTLAGDYIGDKALANFVCRKLKVKPEKRRPEHNSCSIGFCENDQKWYGWGRAYHGFGIGHTVKKGNCSYKAPNKKDFLDRCVDFWTSEYHENMEGIEITDEELGKGIEVSWINNDKVPNERVRGTSDSTFTPYPKKFGKGEWTAKTLEDCKQMAIDFVDGVS